MSSRTPHPRSQTPPLKLSDFEIQDGNFRCKVCPSSSAHPAPWLLSRDLKNHYTTQKHQRHSKAHADEAAAKRRRTTRAASVTPASVSNSSQQSVAPGGLHPESDVMDCDAPCDTSVPVLETELDAPNTLGIQWTDEHGRRVYFTAGRNLDDPLAQSFTQALNGSAETWPEGLEKPMMDFFSGEWQDIGDSDSDDVLFPDDDASADELYKKWFQHDKTDEWFPYPDKAMFLTDVLFNSPRLRFSRAQQKAILSWAKELGASVPSYHAFRQCEGALKAEVGDPTRKETSAQGNIWYLNEIGESIAKDIANPISRADMNFYPEYIDNAVKELSNGSKMLEDVPDELLSPSVKFGGRIYYVGELVRRTENRWFLPTRWIRIDGQMWAIGHNVVEMPDGLQVVYAERKAGVPVSSFVQNIEDILNSSSGIYPFAAASQHLCDQMPHPLRAVAGSRPVYSVPIIIFIDDVSGNKSKQWNKHWACYMSNGSLPREKILQEFHVRFVATSPHATPLEIMQGVRSSIERSFHDPVTAYDCEEHEECLFRTFPVFWAGDNPMQAELCSGSGLNANCFCRTCKLGGSQEHKRSDQGFNEIFAEGIPRNSHETQEHVFQQLLTALQPNVVTALEEGARETGIKDAVAQPIIDMLVRLGQQLRKANPNSAAYTPDEIQSILTEELKKAHARGPVMNPLLDMQGVDIHQDTPTEILHTVLLGVVKYFWGQTMWLLDKNKKMSLFQSRLNSVAAEGLNIPPIAADYMCQYRGGLIGKHFKTISQIMAFTVYDLVPQEVLDAWLLLGNLTVLLWHTEIDDLDQYLTDLQKCIDDFLNVTAQCSPGILISKPKFHFLVHLPSFIRRFGPAILFSTERFESYNAVFRAAAIHSNRAAPSRDIAWTFAGLDRVKHIVTGGVWWSQHQHSWTRASDTLLRYIVAHPEHATLLGLPTGSRRGPGDISWYSKRDAKKQPDPIVWHQSQASTISAGPTTPPTDTTILLQEARDITSVSLDTVKCEDHVLVQSEGGEFSPLHFGRIKEILVSSTKENIWITVQLFHLDAVPHVILGMPTLVLSESYVVLHPKDIVCAVNLQHDCHHGHCLAERKQYLMQERTITTQSRILIQHTDDKHFIVNMHGLHNHKHVLKALPSHLHKFAYVVNDVPSLRQKAAAKIRHKKEEQLEAKRKHLVTKIQNRANISSSPDEQDTLSMDDSDPMSNSETRLDMPEVAVVNGLQDDNQLIDLLSQVFIRHDDDSEQHLGPTNRAGSIQLTQPQPDNNTPGAQRALLRATNASNTQDHTPLDDTTITVLKYYCRQEGLKQSGNKVDVLQRLKDHYYTVGKTIPVAAEISQVYKGLRAHALLAKVSKVSSSAHNQESGDVTDMPHASGSIEGNSSLHATMRTQTGKRQTQERGRVSDTSRTANEKALRGLIFSM